MSPVDVAAALRREVYWKVPADPAIDLGGLAVRLSER
jgi:hypothetical protein